MRELPSSPLAITIIIQMLSECREVLGDMRSLVALDQAAALTDTTQQLQAIEHRLLEAFNINRKETPT